MMLFTDLIEIKVVTENSPYGDELTTLKQVKCRYESVNRVVNSREGQELRPSIVFFVSSNETVKEGDMIRLLKKKDYTSKDTISYMPVKAVMEDIAYGEGMLEVYC